MREIWHKHWLLRWTVANIFGWSIALFIAAIFIWLFGAIGALLSGAIIGCLIGIVQAWILFTSQEMRHRRNWILFSTGGGFLGIFPATVIAIVSLLNTWLGAFLVGVAFCSLLGGLQAIYLVRLIDERAYMWIPLCAIAGGFASLLTVPLLTLGLPIFFSLGSIIYALLTGFVLLRWLPSETTTIQE